MALEVISRPGVDYDYRAKSKFRTVGFTIAVFGIMLAMVTLVANLIAGGLVTDPGQATQSASILAWSFGLTTTAFATLKVAIAVVLMGIVLRLWLRVDAVKSAVARVKPSVTGSNQSPVGDYNSDFGPATETVTAPDLLPIHKMAKSMWAPMLVMGVMAVLVGLVLSFVQSASVSSDPALAVSLGAWTQGTQFLGEGFLLAGISFLLGTVLAGLRQGGGEVQQALGVNVRVLKMPETAKWFVALMAAGLMVAMTQFVLYIVVATSVETSDAASWFAWLGPVREFGLGLLLLGIVLALVTIGKALSFQFQRITQIIHTGR
jgi:hypothetical protein